MDERGVEVDHSTIYRWVQRYAPEIEKRLRWHYRSRCFSETWHIDETYIKIKGQWVFLYRAITKSGDTIDFYRFCRKHLQSLNKPLIRHSYAANAINC